ncbi:hypothetical protein BDA96_04G166400 [Sorghum bicolor]|uniref:Uncharacterized protein n=2 Tax=Sorghum bicolor TaxID=4558 RepID=A0A194YPW8_SORBI|nr:uncharacterized protein LOC110434546 [Sorghum bicolor]KAG0533132.1 hypothetical protein BDA96_04G166400 [Sorghum bicolor]KXG30278.1 hypothetical protein SORBI_3004G156300 [Sorghum bicolor]OQU85007.1 hypothetical protein SORBI_3004G156300 [Sorghum bicolor]|eukprot:XP_021314451.1 uncharacterized protein LOC110434546 [Sorghum bicolor]
MKEGGEKKNILSKTLQRCRTSLLAQRRRPERASSSPSLGVPVPAAGYFTVLVGPEKERFGVRARCANHPLFRALLDAAEAEYGFAGCDGPLELPCAVDDFMEVMWEMEQADPSASPAGCGRFAAGSSIRAHHHHLHHQAAGGYQMVSPARFLVAGR